MAGNNVGEPLVARPSPTRRYTQWHWSEVYGIDTTSTNVYVPNVNDTVLDTDKQILYKVTAVNNNIPVLEQIGLNGISGVKTEDIIFGTGPGLCSEGYRVYVNNSILPHPLCVDTRLFITGSEAAYVKLFKGVDTSDRGTVVSGVFNSAGRMVSENISLEVVPIPHLNNTNYKTIKAGHMTETLADGETVTCVVYTNSGQVYGKFKLIVVNTEFVRNIDAARKTITDIDLVTPYLSVNDNRLVEVPLGMVTQSVSFMGRVTYSDGSTSTFPVDNTKFSLHGLDTYVSTNVGESRPVVLQYTLSQSEFSNFIKTDGVNRRFITKDYRLKTIESETNYQVKLFVLPYWDSAALAYRLKFKLCNLSRDIYLDVTNLIEYSQTGGTFNGKDFGNTQTITVAFDLSRLGPGYSYYRHVETFKITLLHPVNEITQTQYWTVEYDNNSTVGHKCIASVSGTPGHYSIDLSNGQPTTQSLIWNWYRMSEPLYFVYSESEAPEPTHVKLTIGDWMREVPVEQLLQLVTNVTATIKNGTLVELEFLKVTSGARLHLGAISLMARML